MKKVIIFYSNGIFMQIFLQVTPFQTANGKYTIDIRGGFPRMIFGYTENHFLIFSTIELSEGNPNPSEERRILHRL